MDSTTVVLDSGIAVFDQFLPQIAIFIIIPLLMGLQKWTWYDDHVPSAISAVVLCQTAAFLLAKFAAPETTFIQTMQTGFAATGSVIVAHRAATWALPKVKAAGTQLLTIMKL